MVPYGSHYTLDHMYKVCKGQVRGKKSIQLSETERRKDQRVQFDRSRQRQEVSALWQVFKPLDIMEERGVIVESKGWSNEGESSNREP